MSDRCRCTSSRVARPPTSRTTHTRNHLASQQQHHQQPFLRRCRRASLFLSLFYVCFSFLLFQPATMSMLNSINGREKKKRYKGAQRRSTAFAEIEKWKKLFPILINFVLQAVFILCPMLCEVNGFGWPRAHSGTFLDFLSSFLFCFLPAQHTCRPHSQYASAPSYPRRRSFSLIRLASSSSFSNFVVAFVVPNSSRIIAPLLPHRHQHSNEMSQQPIVGLQHSLLTGVPPSVPWKQLCVEFFPQEITAIVIKKTLCKVLFFSSTSSIKYGRKVLCR